VFHDATGRGSLGTSFARLWSPATNPVEFGGAPTQRPVCSDLYKLDEDTGQRRLIRCDEYFVKRVTQYWYTVRLIMEGRQLRGMTDPVLDELCARKLLPPSKGDKKQVEPKEDTKERLGRSPDLADWCAIVCEGAMRLGFQITRLAAEQEEEDVEWKNDLRDRAKQFRQSFALDYSVN
jgi:hypothetical protein